MGAKANPNRRTDIAAALKRAKPNDMLSLEDLAYIYGTTKGPFVTAKKNMPGMPPPVLQGTQHNYAARRALKAMLDYETRNDIAATALAQRQRLILGGVGARREKEAAQATTPPRELAILARMAAETEERERQQRLYIPAAEVAKVSGDVFAELSEFMAGLSNAIDPNGLLDPQLRAMVDERGSEALLRFHKQMKHILDADADAGTDRGTADRAGSARARRKR